MENIEIKTPKGARKIGPGEPVFIIAELSANHAGKYETALKLVDAAIEAGADAIKVQTYTADTMTIDCDNDFFRIKSNKAWAGKTLYELYEEAYMPWEWQPKLKAHAESKGVLFFSTPFDATAVDFLEEMRVNLYKVASFEITDIPLLKKIGSTKKHVLISRGMASEDEIKEAIATLKMAGAPQVAVLHCVSDYPAVPAQMNLSTVPDISKRFNVVSGLSDHSLGIIASLTSVALGSSIIEKHMTIKRAEGGPDAAFSLEPAEFKELVKSVRAAEAAIGKPTYDAGDKEKENKVFRRSIFVVKDIEKGECFTEENIRVIRPGQGLLPKQYETVIGKSATQNIKRGTPLDEKLFNN